MSLLSSIASASAGLRALTKFSRRPFSLALAVVGVAANPALAQHEGRPAEPLDSLITHAIRTSPAIRAAEARVEAARPAVGPSGALPDPMLIAGITNFPVSEPGFEDFMTMKMLGVGQTVPYPGKLALSRRVAAAELAASEARLDAARLAVIHEVRTAYYDLVFVDRAIEIVERNESLLATLVRATESRYQVGTGSQADVLTSRVELARLAEEAVALAERRTATLARLNAALDRPTGTPVGEPDIPEWIARAAVAEDVSRIRFTSAALGSRAADSPLPPLEELQERAVRESPMIRAHEVMIQAQSARVELARKEHLPDFDLSLQYGQRDSRPDMLSAMVSIALPVRRAGKQDLMVTEAEATLAALQAEHHEQANAIRVAVAALYSDLERDRARLALFVKSIIPQARGAVESATAGFQVGRVEFLTLLENQATLYDYETQYHRALTGFAAGLADLERTVGGEILR